MDIIYSVSSRGNHAHVNGTHNYVFKIQTYALVCTLYLFLAQNSLVVCTIFPRIIAVPQLIASVEYSQPPPSPTHPHPSCLLLFCLPHPCQVKVESDPAKLISDNSSSDAEDIDIEN